MFKRNSVQAYANVALETDIDAASPHKLVGMLLDGALAAIARARQNMLDKNIAAKGKAITHAIAIISEGLKPGLNLEAGGEIAENLFRLYDYMCRRLLEANLTNQAAILDEVSSLLGEIKEAWVSIGQSRPAAPQAVPALEARPSKSYGQA